MAAQGCMCSFSSHWRTKGNIWKANKEKTQANKSKLVLPSFSPSPARVFCPGREFLPCLCYTRCSFWLGWREMDNRNTEAISHFTASSTCLISQLLLHCIPYIHLFSFQMKCDKEYMTSCKIWPALSCNIYWVQTQDAIEAIKPKCSD